MNISGGGTDGLAYETGTYIPTEDIELPTINFSNTHTVPPKFIHFYDATGTYDPTTYTNWQFIWVDSSDTPSNEGETSFRYATAIIIYRTTLQSSFTNGFQVISRPHQGGDSAGYYYDYWVSESSFMAGRPGGSTYWRANRTYKWIAVWAPST